MASIMLSLAEREQNTRGDHFHKRKHETNIKRGEIHMYLVHANTTYMTG
jgi:hypothetical protein